MKHTNTDWTFENIFGRLIVTSGKKGFVIAEVTNIGVAHFLGNEEEAIANAKLIAAAPELLRACIESLAALKSGYIQQRAEATELILTAINKATE